MREPIGPSVLLKTEDELTFNIFRFHFGHIDKSFSPQISSDVHIFSIYYLCIIYMISIYYLYIIYIFSIY